MTWTAFIMGVIIGFGIAGLIVANQSEDYAKSIKETSVIEFVDRLKLKVQKPEYPWEDFFVCESDIDKTLEEIVLERKINELEGGKK